MLIISKFRDYYDSSVGISGIDKLIVYDRDQKKVNGTYFSKMFDSKIYKSRYRLMHMIHPKRGDRSTRGLYIFGFCGRTYVVLFQSEYGKENIILFGEDILSFVFENEKNHYAYLDCKQFITDFHNKEDLTVFVNHKVPCFIEFVTGVNQLGDIGNGYGIPAGTTLLNPNLKELQFFKIKDSFTTFQSIQNFISGVIGINTKEPVEIEDKYKVQQYGFDPKWSFRNPDPPKRKQKK